MLWRGCVLRVGVIGMSFKTAQLNLLEEIAKGAQYLLGQKSIFFKHPTIVLSTCNRTEIYFSAIDLAEAQGDILTFLRLYSDNVFEHKLYSYFGIDAFTHLCRVTCGLDSAILAETEIQRQVKIAYQKSAQNLILPECLHYVFQKSLKIAKDIRHQFVLGKKNMTLYGTLWKIAKDVLEDVRKKRILLLGYSEINRGFASFLIHKGIRQFSLCTTNPDEIRLDCVLIFGRDLLETWQDFDLIVCATKSEKYLIEGKGRGNLIFDLSVPRNVNPVIEQATLLNIEQIHQIIEMEQKKRGLCLSESEAFLEKSVLHSAQIYRNKIEKKSSLVY